MLLYILQFWLFLELINFCIFIYIYTFKIKPKEHIVKHNAVKNIIDNIKKSTKDELISLINTAIWYNLYDNNIKDINDLTRYEVILMLYNYIHATNYNPYKPLEEYSKKEKEDHDYIINLVDIIEKKCNIQFKTNHKNIRYLFFEWGKNFIEFKVRPFFIIFLIRLVTNIIHFIMIKYYKCKYYKCNITGIGYLYSENNNYKKDLLFIHGFGIGYIPYIFKILYLMKRFNVTIMILPEISYYNWYDDYMIYFPNIKNLQTSFYNYLEFRNIDKINVIAHSFGTYIYKILNDINRFDKVILVDPIIFWIGSIQLLHHIENPDSYSTIESFINYFVYNCIHIKYICYRYMWGHDFWIYDTKEIETKNILIVLEENDHVIASNKIYNFIKDKNINYYLLKDARHTTVFLDNKYNKIFEEIIDFIE